MNLNGFVKVYKKGKKVCLFNPLTLERFYFSSEEYNNLESSKKYDELVEK